MATKPIVTPLVWAGNANWTTGPFVGFPTKAVPGAGVAADGHRPGSNFPTAAEHENSQQNRVTQWVTNWLALGSSAGAADAHVVESDAVGRSALVGLTLNDAVDETVLSVTGVNTLAPTAFFTCTTGATCVQSDIGNSTGTCFNAPVGTGAGTGYGASLSGTAAGGSGASITCDAATAGVGVRVAHAGSGDAVNSTATGTGVAARFVGSLAALSSVIITGGTAQALTATGNGTGAGGRFFSGGTAGADALTALTLNDDGFALRGTTPGTASSTARALRASAGGAAIGAEVTATGNIALLIQGDTTAPSFPEVRHVGQNAQPASTTAGGFYYNSTRGQWEESDPGAGSYRGRWASAGGFAHGDDGNNAVSTNGTLIWVAAASALLTGLDAPKVGGETLILKFTAEARIVAGGGGGPATLNFRLRDTANAALQVTTLRTGAGFGDGAGFLLNDNVTGWQRNIVFTHHYTVSAGARTIVAEIQAAGATDIRLRDASLVCDGCY